jgi:hypothetical protein
MKEPMTHTLSFEIDYQSEKAGWINCWLTINGERHHFEASYAFPPFVPLLRFVKAVAGQRFPVKFFWDEEGHGVDFEAVAIAEDNPLVHLKVIHDGDVCWFDDVIERQTIIQVFLPPIVDFSKHFWKAEVEWYTPKKLVDQFQQAILAGIPLRSDTHLPQPVECSVSGDYENGSIEGYVSIHITFEEETIVWIHLFDTHPFWREWLDFLGGIANGNLPATCEHHRILHLNLSPPDEDPVEWRSCTRLVAEPLDMLENFRLKIFTNWQDEPEFLRMDEVVDRRKFASGFTDSFKKFLKKEYKVMPDPNGKTFDLRALPLGKFKQT